MFCDTTKVKLHNEVSGSGAPLIMLHGSGEDISIFDRAVPLLEKHFTVYRIDSRCHGQSTMNVPLHYELIADDVYGFIVLNRIEKPIVYGFSDGGIAALMLAYTHPDAVRAIAAFCSGSVVPRARCPKAKTTRFFIMSPFRRILYAACFSNSLIKR